MMCGYSSGWVSESLGKRYLSVEVSCQGRDDESCVFITAPLDKIRARVEEYCNQHNFTQRQRQAIVFLSDKQINFDDMSKTGAAGRKRNSSGISNVNVSKSRKAKKLSKSLQSRLKALSEREKGSDKDDEDGEEIREQMKSSSDGLSKLFSDLICDPRQGKVTVNGERYVFFRGETLSVLFFSIVQELLAPGNMLLSLCSLCSLLIICCGAKRREGARRLPGTLL